MIVIRGFTIQNASRIDTVGICRGSGISIENANVLLDDLKILNNSLFADNVNNFRHCYGAGLYMAWVNATILNSTFNNNSIQNTAWGFGAGLYADSCRLTIEYCHFDSNRIDSGNYNSGPGLYVQNCFIDIVNSTFNHNLSTWGGYNFGTACFEDCITNINSCEISDNIASSGGFNFTAGMYFFNGSSTITNSKFQRNSLLSEYSQNFGSALYFRQDAVIENCLVTDNFLDSMLVPMKVGSVFCSRPQFGNSVVVKFNHCTIANNSFGGGYPGYGIVRDQQTATDTIVSLEIYNSILWNNCPSEISTLSNIHVDNSDIQFNTYGGSSSFSLNPNFISSTDYHLWINSPCFNAGIQMVNQDIDQNPRPQPVGHAPDLGCYESDETVISVPMISGKSEILIHQVRSHQFEVYSDEGKYFVCDISGRIIQEGILEGHVQNRISVNPVTNGIYFIKAVSNNASASYKFIEME